MQLIIVTGKVFKKADYSSNELQFHQYLKNVCRVGLFVYCVQKGFSASTEVESISASSSSEEEEDPFEDGCERIDLDNQSNFSNPLKKSRHSQWKSMILIVCCNIFYKAILWDLHF